MPADTSIYSLIKPPAPVEGPLDQYAKILGLRGMQDESQLRSMQREQLASQLEEDRAYRGAAQESGGDLARLRDILMQRGAPKSAMSVEAQRIKAEKDAADLMKTKVETHTAQIKQLRDQLATVNDDSGLAAVREQAMKLYGPQAVANMPQSVSDPNFNAWRQKNLLTADQLVSRLNPKYELSDFGGEKKVVQVNPEAPGGVTGLQPKTMTPGEIAADRRAAAQLAEMKSYHQAMIGTPPNANDPDYTNQINYWAQVVRNGGTLPPGLARGPGGGAFVREVTKRAAMGEVTPEDMMANQARFAGEKAGQRTLGTRTANIEMAATEAASLADLAKQASEKVSRTDYKSLNDVIQAGQKATASPELRAFTAANTSLVNAYARAINPQGVGTVADKEHAREMLSTAFSKGDYRATVDQLLQEIEAARKSPGTVQREMRDRFTGNASKPSGGAQETRSNASPAPSGGIKFLGWEK